MVKYAGQTAPVWLYINSIICLFTDEVLKDKFY